MVEQLQSHAMKTIYHSSIAGKSSKGHQSSAACVL